MLDCQPVDVLLGHDVLLRNGRLGKAGRAWEEDPEFVATRRQYPTVDLAVHRLLPWLDPVRACQAGSVAPVVAVSVLAFNLHHLGLPLRHRDKFEGFSVDIV